jgi:5-methylcytosine-specific restriction endonuclease McrA
VSSGSFVRTDLRAAIYERDGHRCVYCGVAVVPGRGPDSRTIDHLEGDRTDNRPEKLVTACRSCNSSKGDRPLARYVRDARERDRIRRQARRGITRIRERLRFERAVSREASRRIAEAIAAGELVPADGWHEDVF